jgi:FkbM family methyltransferase
VQINCRQGTDDAQVADGVWKHEEYHNAGYIPQLGWDVLDIGAHIGTYALWAGSMGSRVTAIEPEPGNFVALQGNIAANEMTYPIAAYQYAVSGRGGPIALYVNPMGATAAHSMCYTLTEQQRRENCITIESIDLAKAIELAGGHVDLCKIDTEGAEYEILFNASGDTLSRIDRLVLEWHLDEKSANFLCTFLHWAYFEIDFFMLETRRNDVGALYSRGKIFARYDHARAKLPYIGAECGGMLRIINQATQFAGSNNAVWKRK